VHDEVELRADQVVFAPLGGRRLRRVGAAVLMAGGAVQLIVGAVAAAWLLVVAGLVAIAFGVSVLRSSRTGTRVTADGWHDPTRVRNQQLAWSQLAAVRLTPSGDHAVVSLERRGEGLGGRGPRRASAGRSGPEHARRHRPVGDRSGHRRRPHRPVTRHHRR
jgi:hypothetical protein